MRILYNMLLPVRERSKAVLEAVLYHYMCSGHGAAWMKRYVCVVSLPQTDA